jgi:hypothetical protein
VTGCRNQHLELLEGAGEEAGWLNQLRATCKCRLEAGAPDARQPCDVQDLLGWLLPRSRTGWKPVDALLVPTDLPLVPLDFVP